MKFPRIQAQRFQLYWCWGDSNNKPPVTAVLHFPCHYLSHQWPLCLVNLNEHWFLPIFTTCIFFLLPHMAPSRMSPWWRCAKTAVIGPYEIAGGLLYLMMINPLFHVVDDEGWLLCYVKIIKKPNIIWYNIINISLVFSYSLYLCLSSQYHLLLFLWSISFLICYWAYIWHLSTFLIPLILDTGVSSPNIRLQINKRHYENYKLKEAPWSPDMASYVASCVTTSAIR